MSDSDDLDSDRIIPETNESGKSRLKREIARTSYRILKWERPCPNWFAKSLWLGFNGWRHFRFSTHTRILDVSLGSRSRAAGYSVYKRQNTQKDRRPV